MKVLIKGGKKFEKDLLEQFTLWAGYKLLGPRIAKNSQVIVHLKKYKEKAENLGSCVADDELLYPRSFLIEVDRSQTPKQLIQTLAHEMTHVKQFAFGELKYPKRNQTLTKWKGETFQDTDVDYWDAEWETEARGREVGLYMQFIELMGLVPQFKKDSPEFTLTPKIKFKERLIPNDWNNND